jgi:hypothetical protein
VVPHNLGEAVVEAVPDFQILAFRQWPLAMVPAQVRQATAWLLLRLEEGLAEQR